MIQASVIIPAAGASSRFGRSAKTELELAGKPVFLRSVELFIQRDDVAQVIVAVHPHRVDEFRLRWGDKLGFLGVTIVPGGETERWQTVLRALEAVSDKATHIAVHDAARPLASAALIERVFAAAERYAAVIPAMPVGQTLKRVTSAAADADAPADPLDAILGDAGKPAEPNVQRVVETVDRADLVAVQTPQVFERELLRRAYAPLTEGDVDAAGVTDDAGLVEALGEPVYVVPGEPTNLKITWPEDAALAAAMIEKREASAAADVGKKRLFADDDEF